MSLRFIPQWKYNMITSSLCLATGIQAYLWLVVIGTEFQTRGSQLDIEASSKK